MRKMLWVVLPAVVVGMISCAKNGEDVSCVKIVPEIETRVTGLHFDTGDCIGLTILKGVERYADNSKLVYDGSAFSAANLLWYNNLNEKSTLTAYSPYDALGAPTEFRIAADQHSGSASSDLLVAVRKEVTPGAAPVKMVFKHLLSQLNIVVTNQSGATVNTVTIGGFAPTATIDFMPPSATVKRGVAAADVVAFEVTPNAKYQVVLVPQQAALTLTVATSDGKTHSKNISSALLESGKRYDLAVVLTPININVTLSDEISDWQDGGAIGGGDAAAGTVTYEGQTYKTKSIGGRVWMAENLRHTPAGVTLHSGVWYPQNVSVVDTRGMLYDYATVLNSEVVQQGVPVRGICPVGWHVPDEAELTALAASTERGADFLCCAGFWNTSINNYGAATKGFLTSSTLLDGRCRCLSYTPQGDQLTMVSQAVGNGLSLRCVQNVQ
ncbi:MAG: fimbrillin family protein [Alistipes sp.]